MPVSLQEWLPEDHLVYLVSDVVDTLDLSEIYAHYEEQLRGQPPYDPRMMVKLVSYAYTVGIPSSRRIEPKTYEDIAFRVLTADQHPDHDTICDFRKTHGKALSRLFVQVLAVCQEAGLVKLGHVSFDGTKVKANASKHKAMSYAYMLTKEAELEKEVAELLGKAQEEDDREDARYGKGRRGDEVPDELRFKHKRLQTLRDAKERLEKRVRDKAIEEGKVNPDGTPKPPRGRAPETPHGQPKPKDQENFTDPESRIMVNGDKAFVQAYNAQAAVDEESQIIVGRGVTNAANDKRQVEPLVEDVQANLGATPDKVSADSGYYSEANLEHLERKGIDPYLPPHRDNKLKAAPPPRGRIPKGLSREARMRRKLRTKKGRETYAKRKGIVEPVFGQIKFGRGLRQFLLRGLENVALEWDLWCMGHNLLKLWGSGWRVRGAQA
ncbi:IS1182 family transposase [bacterium]|nr:IS1182 family transposase [bacterium]